MKSFFSKIWSFLSNEDSALSWIVNILLMFVLIKYIIYPGIGLALGTQFPIVAVVSESMEHEGSFEEWWMQHGEWYEIQGITGEQFVEFPFKDGFNKGDIMVLVGSKPENIELGDIITFQTVRKYPIIHRVVGISEQEGQYFFQTKGDNNQGFITAGFDERSISEEIVLGRSVLRIPYLGWVKIGFVSLLYGEVR